MNLKKFILAGGLAFAGLVATQSVSLAQPCDPLNPPPGEPYTCVIVDGQKVIVDAYGNPTAGQSEGDAQFITNKGGEVPCQTNQTPQSFNVSVKTDLGVIKAQLDPERQSPLATIVANQDKEALPATATISVYLIAENSSKPGEIYRSEGLVTFVNREVRSFPFKEEHFGLTEKVTFVNEKDPKDYFTLAETKVVLTSQKGK